MFVDFFIKRPIFASVIAIVIVIAGGISIPTLPVAEFPPITPPSVQVSATYYGANAEVVERTVATPIEEQVNGVEGMLYMSSVSSDDGTMTLTVTFEVGYDLDIAAVDVQNRVAIAQAQLPDEVTRSGVTVQKQSTDMTLVVNLISPNGKYDDIYLGNYADIHIDDVLKRIPGVGNVTIFGERTYAMRIWLSPDKMAGLGLAASDIASAIEEQNAQVAAGQIGQPPAPANQKFQYTITTQGRLEDVSEFADIIIKTRPDGSVVRIKDVARVELGAETYDSYAQLNGASTIPIGIYQLPDANSLDVATQVKAEMERLSKRFPDDVEYRIVYDSTEFVSESIKEVLITLLEAVGLVFLVVYVFLQGWRATLIPAVTIPVSLIGTFALMKVLGFSTNTLSLFGLVLAIGLVVDDAIVVVESVSRSIEDEGLSPGEAASRAMGEVTGPIIATSLVLMAVFVPVAFIPGTTGQLYKQFALTIACAVGISTINALTLSPALCALILRPESDQRGWFFRTFNRVFKWSERTYEQGVKHFVQKWGIVVGVFVVLLGVTYYMFTLVPTGFIPEEDQGYFMVIVQGPEGSSLARTTQTDEKVTKILQDTPGVSDVLTIGGYSLLNGVAAPNMASMFIILKPWSERKSPDLKVEAIISKVRESFAGINEAIVLAFNPPAIQGLGTTGGFQFELQDLSGDTIDTLAKMTEEMVEKGNERPELVGLYSSFRTDTPQLYLELDRTKSKTLDIPISDVFDTLQIYLGALYVNDFNKFGRVYRVFLQAEEDSRSTTGDISRLYVRSNKDQMVPLSTLVNIRPLIGPRTITHYNLYRTAEIDGDAMPGFSSGQAIKAMEQTAAEILPEDMGYEWTGITYQQLKAGNLAPVIFALALVFVFLFLAAQYESWTMPFMVMFAVPLALLGALLAQWLRGLVNDVYCQIGLVMLIGLASKNAILIVEFARRRREEGAPVLQAAMEAARIRLRPILMTAFAFILGVVPLVLASGAGAAGRHSLGTAVFGGMIVSTMLSLIVVPVLYVLIEGLREKKEAVRADLSAEQKTSG